MWSDHDRIRGPHAKYQHRKRPEAVRKKGKQRLLIDGIFVVVVVLEAVGWIRTGYKHPVLDRFLSKM
jgi:hypothetical protein